MFMYDLFGCVSVILVSDFRSSRTRTNGVASFDNLNFLFSVCVIGEFFFVLFERLVINVLMFVVVCFVFGGCVVLVLLCELWMNFGVFLSLVVMCVGVCVCCVV